MSRTLPIIGALLLAFALAACGGGDDDGGASEALDIFFAPDNADALAHATLPRVADLPGRGWEVAARDDFGDDDEDDDFNFETFAASEPACSQLSALVNLGGILGSDDEELPAGRAQVEFENAPAGSILANSVEFEPTRVILIRRADTTTSQSVILLLSIDRTCAELHQVPL